MRRYRVLLWVNEAHVPLTWAVATYVDDEKLTEYTRESEPFGTVHDALDDALESLDVQMTLW